VCRLRVRAQAYPDGQRLESTPEPAREATNRRDYREA
jgi:hypothetical protein